MTEKERLREQIQYCEAKLSNPLFLENAKPEIVEKENQKLRDFQNKLECLNDPFSFMVKDTKFTVRRIIPILLLCLLCGCATTYTGSQTQQQWRQEQLKQK